MTDESGLSPESHARIDEILRVAKEAVLAAQAESRRLGVPNVYGIDGKIYYELPNGELSLTDPYSANPPRQ